MILTETRGTVVTSDDVKPSQFRIKASKKAFEILSAGLYSNKVKAIVRELSTNAYDSHVMAAKKEVPFEVHLPNTLEPWFAVKDWGVGLSDQAVHTVYTTYFESDKADSNDYTGCLGLGSKSPFSYTDSFTVESRYNGIITVYNAYLTEDGLPSIAKMTEDFTDEENGITVKFPVKNVDFVNFIDEAKQVLQWFATRPNIVGVHNFELPTREYLIKTEKFAVVKKQDYRSYVVMGNVAYPIDRNDEFLRGYDSNDEKLRKLVQWGVEFYVGIGDVNISASREKLSYDKATCVLLKKLTLEAFGSLNDLINKEIQAMPTLWQARRKLYEVRQSFNGFGLKAEWNGAPLNDVVKIGYKTKELGDGKEADVQKLVTKSKNGNRIVIKKESVESIHADGTAIFINDGRGAYAAVRRYMETKDHNCRCYMINSYDEEWMKDSGILEVAKKTSTLPKATRVVGEKTTTQKAKVYEFVQGTPSDNRSAGSYWEPVDDVDLDDGGVYVEILYFSYRFKEGEETRNPYSLVEPIRMLRRLGKDFKVYGIRPADLEILKKSDGEWMTLQEYAKEFLEEVNNKFAEAYKSKERIEHAGRYDADILDKFKEKDFAPDSEFGKLVGMWKEASSHADLEGLGDYIRLRCWAGYTDDAKYDDLKEAKEAVFVKYPLLSLIGRSYLTHDDKKAITEYIKLIDGTR